MTEQEAIEILLPEVKRLGRFDTLDTMVDPLSNDEITASIYDARDDINSFPPETFWTLAQICDMTDTRWKRLVVLKGACNSLTNMIFQWTADGMDIQIGEFTLQDKLSSYQTLQSNLNTQFEETLAKLKIASQNFSSAQVYNPNGSLPLSPGLCMRLSRYKNSRVY